MKGAAFALLGLTGLMTTLAYLPLAWIGGPAVPSYVQPRPSFLGTVWNGQVGNIEGINPVDLSVKPAHLIRGKPPAAFKSHSPYLRFSGMAKVNGSVSVTANGDITGLRVFDARFGPLSGTYDLSLQDALVRDSCRSATGQLSTNILTENARSWQWQGPVLAGPVTCENGRFIASLTGSDNQQNIQAKFQLDLTGGYRAEIDVTTADPNAEFVLPLFGFEKTAKGYSLAEAGAWK